MCCKVLHYIMFGYMLHYTIFHYYIVPICITLLYTTQVYNVSIHPFRERTNGICTGLCRGRLFVERYNIMSYVYIE